MLSKWNDFEEFAESAQRVGSATTALLTRGLGAGSSIEFQKSAYSLLYIKMVAVFSDVLIEYCDNNHIHIPDNRLAKILKEIDKSKIVPLDIDSLQRINKTRNRIAHEPFNLIDREEYTSAKEIIDVEMKKLMWFLIINQTAMSGFRALTSDTSPSRTLAYTNAPNERFFFHFLDRELPIQRCRRCHRIGSKYVHECQHALKTSMLSKWNDFEEFAKLARRVGSAATPIMLGGLYGGSSKEAQKSTCSLLYIKMVAVFSDMLTEYCGNNHIHIVDDGLAKILKEIDKSKSIPLNISSLQQINKTRNRIAHEPFNLIDQEEYELAKEIIDGEVKKLM